MRRTKLWAIAAAALCAAQVGGAATIAIDIDSTRLSGTDVSGTLTTQPGFTSWDLTTFTQPAAPAVGPTITEQGITFEIFGTSANNSRIRTAGGGGGSENNILTDFVFNEGASGRAVGLRITNLPIGRYGMQSWHFDSGIAASENFIQVEVRDQGGPATLLVDKFPFGTSPAYFAFDVTSVGQVREIIFREDDVANPAGDNVDQNRARLNGFTLASIPEPSTLALAGVALGLAAWRARRK
jgi:hypothetical protein